MDGPLDMSVSIVCPIAAGHPPPEITWLKGGRPLDQLNDATVYTSSSRQKLFFGRLQRQHLDRYECVARNPAGEDRLEFRLNLLEAPKIDESSQFMWKGGEGSEEWMGRTLIGIMAQLIHSTI